MSFVRALPRLGVAVLVAVSVAVAMLASTADAATWQWPLSPRPEMVRGFHPPDAPWGAGHRGVDLAATAGQSVRAAGAGRVTYAGLLAGRGVIVVSHGELRTTYEPVAATVSVGAQVAAGASLGSVQAAGSHCAPRACLHWGLRRGVDYLDPLTLVGLGPPRLLPLDGSSGEAAEPVVSAGPAAPTGDRPEQAGVAEALGPFAAPVAGAVAGAVVAGVLLRRVIPPTGPPAPPPRHPASPGTVVDLDEVRRRLRRSA